MECFDHSNQVDEMILFVNKFRHWSNGFVLDYNQWLINATYEEDGKSLLEKLVSAVTHGKTMDSATGDNAKHLFMRFPILDKRFVTSDNAEELVRMRIAEEETVRRLGIRVVIETLSMDNDPNACDTVECLDRLSQIVQDFGAISKEAYRAFAIDDPTFGKRTSPGNLWGSREALNAFSITALPGSPILYYGSEIGMSNEINAHMQWTDLNNNTCYDSSYMCFCNTICETENGAENRTCPFAITSHDASVREQIREQSTGPLKSVVQLLVARQLNDSLLWGSSIVTVDQATPEKQKIVVVTREAVDFERFVLFLSMESDSNDREAVPHLPANIANQCYETVYSFANGQISSSDDKRRFSEMVLKAGEVRLVRVFTTCAACAIKAKLGLTIVIALLASFFCRH